MKLNEIKKELYKKKPSAKINKVNADGIHYSAVLTEDKDGTLLFRHINFVVPLKEIGESDFTEFLPSQLLIRYINIPDESELICAKHDDK